MREIKFRAWDKKEKTMILFGSAETSSTSGFWGDGVDNYKIQFEREGETNGYNHDDFNESAAVDLMQYTGLKDKNGVEIYEGDKISYPTKNHLRKGRVSMKDGIFGITVYARDVRDEQIPLFKFIRKHGVEVIGNIYENQE